MKSTSEPAPSYPIEAAWTRRHGPVMIEWKEVSDIPDSHQLIIPRSLATRLEEFIADYPMNSRAETLLEELRARE